MLLEGLGIHLLTPLQTICAFEAQMLCKELEIEKKTERAKWHWQGQIIVSQNCLVGFILVQDYSAALSK